MNDAPIEPVSLQDQIALVRLLSTGINTPALRALLNTLLDLDTAELDAVRIENTRYRQINAELEEELRQYEEENASLRVLLTRATGQDIFFEGEQP